MSIVNSGGDGFGGGDFGSGGDDGFGAPQGLDDQSSLYDVLGLTPDATPNEIREAYLLTKASFQKDSPALYSLMDSGETTDILEKIERAYQVLSNPIKRKDYDRTFDSGAGDPLLNPPSTDITGAPPLTPDAATANARVFPRALAAVSVSPAPRPPAYPPVGGPPPGPHGQVPRPHEPAPSPAPQAPAPAPSLPPEGIDLEAEIRAETAWSGGFLRIVRKARGLSVEDLMGATRISKAYLMAIEDEEFTKLPAPVYTRGFIVQIAKLLQLPQVTVANAYLERYSKACPRKFQ